MGVDVPLVRGEGPVAGVAAFAAPAGRAPLNCPEPIPRGLWVASIIKPIWAGNMPIEFIEVPV